MTKIAIQNDRVLDVIVLGRAGVDLYANEHNTNMSDVSSFKPFVGGSAGNIAVAINRLGSKVGFISGVANDGFGNFVRTYLTEMGINLDGVLVDDSGSKTSVAFCEMKPSGGEVIIYRNNASDLTIKPEDIKESYIASAKVLVVTGAALSQSPSREATLLAMEFARKHEALVVLDVDYRPYSWRTDVDASIYYGIAAGLSDIVIGNREEFDMMETVNAPGNNDDDATASRFLRANTQVVIIKAGEMGSKVYCRDGHTFSQGIFPVTVTKPFGSGDSFAGALIHTLVNGGSLEEGVKLGSAAAAINVSSNSCTEAMPTPDELKVFISNY